MLVLKLGTVFRAGLVVIGFLILYEHLLVRADDLKNIPVAFFNVNAAVSLILLVFTVTDVLVAQ
jgi:4-hydroxybenzoate polyprenyltransferase